MEVKLSPSDIDCLKKLQRASPDRWSYIRVTVVLMLAEGMSVSKVSSLLGIDDNTVYRTISDYRSRLIEDFLNRDYKGYSGKLHCMGMGALSIELGRRLFTSAKEVCEWVSNDLGIDYTPSGMAKLLGRLGFVYKKTKQVPCEADPAKQEAFMERLAEVLSERDSEVYFMDAVHPTHNTRSLYGWIESGKEFELPTVSGRDRVNINGAVNAKDPARIVAREDGCINAQSTKELYRELLEKHKEGAVFVVSDNARYYKNAELREWLADEGKRIVQVFLPPYSPNLNLIERLWKLLRKKAIDPVFYRTKEEFRAGILSFFENTAQYAQELRSLLTLNFRVVGGGRSYSFA